MQPSHLLAPAVVLGLTLPALAAPQAPLRLQAVEVAYDQQALALSFNGTPLYAIQQISPTHAVVWLENVRLGNFGVRGGRLGMHAWAVAEQPGALRVEITMATPGTPVVAADPGHNRLLIVPQAAPVGPIPAEGVTTILGRAAFEPGLDAIVVPYYGRNPQVHVSGAGPLTVQVDVANAAVNPSGLQLNRMDEHPLITAWSLTRLPGQAASRVTMSFRYPAGADVRVDEPRHRLLIRPVLGSAAALPFTGTPVTSVSMSDRRPLPTQWTSAAPLVKPAAPGKAPQVMASGQPMRVVIEVAPGQPIPQVVAVPAGSQGPVSVPMAQPTLPPQVSASTPPEVAPSPEATPSPTASAAPEAPAPGVVIRRVALNLRPEFTGEALVAGAVDFGPALVPAVGLNARYDLDEVWTLAGAFSYRDYTMADAGAPASRHHRDDFILDAHAAYRFPTGAWQPYLGLGYYGRQVSVANSAPPSLARPFVFAPTQIFHGPLVVGGVQGQLGNGWRAEIEASARPILFTGGHETVTALGNLFGYGARPSVSWAWNGLEANFGYQFDYMTAYTNDFTHIKHGPFVDAAWRF